VTPAALTANLVALVLFASECGGDDEGDELASLDGSSWILVEGEGITIPGAVMPTIAFEAGRVSGSGGCNRFTGSYEEEGETLSLGMLASTRMACAEDVMRAETAYLPLSSRCRHGRGTGASWCSRTARAGRCSATRPG
jgi:heat shock protein HslJ